MSATPPDAPLGFSSNKESSADEFEAAAINANVDSVAIAATFPSLSEATKRPWFGAACAIT